MDQPTESPADRARSALLARSAAWWRVFAAEKNLRALVEAAEKADVEHAAAQAALAELAGATR